MAETKKGAERADASSAVVPRVIGSLAAVGGFALAILELARHPINPELPWLAVFLVMVLAGVGLRIEAAIRDGRDRRERRTL
ncbi:hypothetical protein [Nonomuraea jabiensis]|uniref:Uncharacterized protein n=1 Tax=Nonomuraea jabiensis TaxID=882448 RepID=A0A7W9LI64_9ACTN|nr:hypothetical protein [Nonomuraea jabiensis]MBB5784618.1 hypothetical protein [Nonomuraea jabiensis]